MTIEKRQLSEQNDNFIMLPTVDFCFKELMQNKEVRKGILSALLGRNPEELEDTELLPTILQPEYQDEKLGILDVRVLFADGTQTNLEMQVVQFDFWPNRVLFYLGKMYTGQIKRGEPYEKLKKCIHVSILDFLHFPKDDRCFRKITFCDVETGEVYTDLMEIYVLELGKLPTEDRNESGIIRWMRFLSGKCKEDLKKMAEKDPYIEKAYEELERMSADEKKRLEYEAREKALRDYNSQMSSARRRGEAIGKEIGEKIGKEIGIKLGEKNCEERIILNMHQLGKSAEEISVLTGCSEEIVLEVLNHGKNNLEKEN